MTLMYMTLAPTPRILPLGPAIDCFLAANGIQGHINGILSTRLSKSLVALGLAHKDLLRLSEAY